MYYTVHSIARGTHLMFRRLLEHAACSRMSETHSLQVRNINVHTFKYIIIFIFFALTLTLHPCRACSRCQSAAFRHSALGYMNYVYLPNVFYIDILQNIIFFLYFGRRWSCCCYCRRRRRRCC